MELHYLDFDISEDADGSAVFDAMASVAVDRLPALWAEIARVLGWAHESFPHARAPLDEGGEWDYLLEGAEEVRTAVELHFDPQAGTVAVGSRTPGITRHSVSLSITGTPTFCEALRSAFELV
ncbi:hypothetical protein [Xylophilus sp. GOD-11R]|uniref:hypothetical protein n=1 Tax=Xylophilus sp. GOD-11R TaxID=3089814 RepID=UPI00298C26A6|nr:hypothetical protein [Xylophilus sp. GOD-11R]WPB56981.1 hypothetical protein R9X41_23080 [Xylophilus sp. GOD-11R]